MDRVEHLRRSERVAGFMSRWSWSRIDRTLGGLNLPYMDRWEGSGDEEDYVVEMLRTTNADDLSDLERYLNMPAYDDGVAQELTIDPDGLPWEPGMVSLFLSHPSAYKRQTQNIATILGTYGVKGFVAHEDLHPGHQWSRGIQNALITCDAFVGLLYPGFLDSAYCQQEVGFAMAREIPMVPVKMEPTVNPDGFFGEIQALQHHGGTEEAIASGMLEWLTGQPQVSDLMTDVLLNALNESFSWDRSRELVALLEPMKIDWTKDRVDVLDDAMTNRQVYDAHRGVVPFIEAAKAEYERLNPHPYVPPPPSGDDIPF